MKPSITPVFFSGVSTNFAASIRCVSPSMP